MCRKPNISARAKKIRRLVVERNDQKIGMTAESDIVRVYPELHYLIREQTRLQVKQISSEPWKVILARYCEECGNYSPQLHNLNGRWLDEDCRTP